MKRLYFFNKIIYVINVISAILLVMACIKPFITSELFSFLSFLSLVLPFLVIINALFMTYWLLQKKRQLLLSLMALVIGYMTQGTFIKIFNTNAEIDKNDIGILSFNSQYSSGEFWSSEPKYGERISKFIVAQDSDIICFQEYEPRTVIDTLQYPYSFVNFVFPKRQQVAQAILSKYPIIDHGTLDLPESLNNAIYADLLINKDTVRIYNLHLESLRVRLGSIKTEAPKRLLGRLNTALNKQQQQAEIINEHRKGTAHRSIVCGDFNNTQFSSVYNTLKGDMTDSFQEFGSGLGTTYYMKFLPFRIDFLLFDQDLEVRSHKNFSITLSDHKPVMASFRLRK